VCVCGDHVNLHSILSPQQQRTTQILLYTVVTPRPINSLRWVSSHSEILSLLLFCFSSNYCYQFSLYRPLSARFISFSSSFFSFSFPLIGQSRTPTPTYTLARSQHLAHIIIIVSWQLKIVRRKNGIRTHTLPPTTQ